MTCHALFWCAVNSVFMVYNIFSPGCYGSASTTIQVRRWLTSSKPDLPSSIPDDDNKL